MIVFLKEIFSTLQIEVIVISVIAFALIITISSLFAALNHKEKSNSKEIEDLSNKTRIYLMDIKNDKVKYFNSSNLKDRKSLSITSFYNAYESREREKLITWIGDLLDDQTETSKYLEVKVYSKKSKHLLPTMLEVQKIDFDQQVIFLESHVLQNEVKAHKRGEKLVFAKRDLLYKKILMSNGKGATFYFNFFNKVTKNSDISQLVYTDLKDIMLGFQNDDILMVEEQFGQIIVTNFNTKDKTEMLSFVNEIKSKINRYLLIKSYSDDISFSVGIIENSESFRDVNSLIKNVMAVSDISKDNTDQVAFFSESKMLITEERGNQYRSDVQLIIEENRFKYLFQPIIDVERGKISAYISSVVPVDSFFKELSELKTYAKRTEDDKELFSTITRNIISRFAQEKGEYNQKLLFPLSFSELSYASNTLARTLSINNVNLVLVLLEKDLSNLPEEYEETKLVELIRSFKSKGYSVALEIDDDILTLSPALYGVFDYFILSVTSHISKKSTGSNLPTFQALIEKLLHYEKPIVAFDIQSWDIVELVYRLGVERICSDAIAEPAENIMPLQKKTLTKIINLKS